MIVVIMHVVLDHALNLSILIRAGLKETNEDFFSSGERRRICSNGNYSCIRKSNNPMERGAKGGDSPFCFIIRKSSIVW